MTDLGTAKAAASRPTTRGEALTALQAYARGAETIDAVLGIQHAATPSDAAPSGVKVSVNAQRS